MPAPSLLAALDAEQAVAARTLLGPVCILAGAGTGKTRAIAHRIAYGVATGAFAQNKVLALTFTTRAAGELRGRLRMLGAGDVQARTFHSAALAQLGHFWPQVVGGAAPQVLDGKARTLAQAAETLRLRLDTASLRDVAAEIEWRKVGDLSVEEYLMRGRPVPQGLDAGQLGELMLRYEQLKDERRQIDFEDVLLACAGMLEVEERVALQVRERYRFFTVDEYQDVSPLQQRLLELWLGERGDVCVVGDASQTIYSFAGASPGFLLGFASRYPGASVIRLQRNYRSSPAIVETANRLMRGRPGALELVAAGEGDERRSGPVPSLTAFPDDRAEARGVAASIARLLADGASASECAVLFRTNVQAAAFEQSLGDEGIPTLMSGGVRFFDQPEVKQALMMLRASTLAAPREPLFKTVSDVLRTLGWVQDAPAARGAVRDRWEALNAILRLAEENPPGTTLAAFVAELTSRAATHHEPTREAVTLATLHSAKGLEWDNVFVVGVSEGFLPIGYARTEAALDEERRLLYVGITRARRRLELSWADAGRGDRAPSRFLADLFPARSPAG